MSTTVTRSTGPGGRWWLALLLAVVVAAIVVAAILISKNKKSTAGPTATARVVVVTGSPTPGGPPTVVITATPASTPSGGSTPLPGATPVPTVPGVKLGMITRPLAQVQHEQTEAGAGNPQYTFYLNPREVVQRTLPSYGFKYGFTITSPASPSPSPTPRMGADGRPVIRFLVSYQGHTYTVAVAQPGPQGPTGIWVVVTILKGAHPPLQ